MGRELILETTFLIDLERERARLHEGPAHRYLLSRADDRLFITFTTAGELAAGVSLSRREAWSDFVDRFRVLASTQEVCWQYGQLYRYLSDNGRLIGTNDLWIAATALANQMPLVTGNVRHFKRVPGLEVEEYR